jgi:2-polyprenyl-3-methyl-5-hydroxy-6-metoxy-1,4-benzoquinol methylase
MKVTLYGIPSQKVVRWILKDIPEIATWADLGCGNGEFLNSIRFAPRKGIGVDMAEPKTLPENFTFEKSDIQEWLARQRKPLDVISMFDVVEHFEKEEAFALVRQAEQAARHLIIATPSGFLSRMRRRTPRKKTTPTSGTGADSRRRSSSGSVFSFSF